MEITKEKKIAAKLILVGAKIAYTKKLKSIRGILGTRGIHLYQVNFKMFDDKMGNKIAYSLPFVSYSTSKRGINFLYVNSPTIQILNSQQKLLYEYKRANQRRDRCVNFKPNLRVG